MKLTRNGTSSSLPGLVASGGVGYAAIPGADGMSAHLVRGLSQPDTNEAPV